MAPMQPCAFANLVTGGAIVLVAAFSGCAGGSAAPEAPDTAGVPEAPAEEAMDDIDPPVEDEMGGGEDTESGDGDPGSGDEEEGGDPPASGKSDRSPADIQAVVKKNRGPVRKCYEAAQEKIPGLKGDMVITFVIKPSGEVKSAQLNIERSTLRSPDVVDCAIDHLMKIKFSRHPKGMESTVDYPFNFVP